MDTDLDIDVPEKLAPVLRKAADTYRESYGELQSAWQDKAAGRIWDRFAVILERAAEACECAMKKEGL
jgi:hypothetical protein